jgi:hypothetical protein
VGPTTTSVDSVPKPPWSDAMPSLPSSSPLLVTPPPAGVRSSCSRAKWVSAGRPSPGVPVRLRPAAPSPSRGGSVHPTGARRPSGHERDAGDFDGASFTHSGTAAPATVGAAVAPKCRGGTRRGMSLATPATPVERTRAVPAVSSGNRGVRMSTPAVGAVSSGTRHHLAKARVADSSPGRRWLCLRVRARAAEQRPIREVHRLSEKVTGL